MSEYVCVDCEQHPCSCNADNWAHDPVNLSMIERRGRRAALEAAIKALAEMPTSRGWTAYETLLHGQQAVRALLDSAGRGGRYLCHQCNADVVRGTFCEKCGAPNGV